MSNNERKLAADEVEEKKLDGQDTPTQDQNQSGVATINLPFPAVASSSSSKTSSEALSMEDVIKAIKALNGELALLYDGAAPEPVTSDLIVNAFQVLVDKNEKQKKALYAIQLELDANAKRVSELKAKGVSFDEPLVSFPSQQLGAPELFVDLTNIHALTNQEILDYYRYLFAKYRDMEEHVASMQSMMNMVGDSISREEQDIAEDESSMLDAYGSGTESKSQPE